MEGSNLLETLRQNIDLGHEQKNMSFLRQVELHTKSPGTSIPKAAGKSKRKIPFADAISMYRFANNEDITLAGLREGRAKTVLSSVLPGSTITLIHDVTLLDYSKHNSKEDRREIGNHRGKGYEYVTCLAVEPESETVLGVIHDTVVNITGPDHVHVIVTPAPENELSSILHSWKSYTSHKINKMLGRSGEIWQKESFDHIIRSEESLLKFRNYIRGHRVNSGETPLPLS